MDDLAVCKANLRETEAALSAATDTIESARELCRQQIQGWRADMHKWPWIKRQPVWDAFRLLGGS